MLLTKCFPVHYNNIRIQKGCDIIDYSFKKKFEKNRAASRKRYFVFRRYAVREKIYSTRRFQRIRPFGNGCAVLRVAVKIFPYKDRQPFACARCAPARLFLVRLACAIFRTRSARIYSCCTGAEKCQKRFCD